MFRSKFVRPELKVIEPGRVEAVVSDESVDRDGDIIRQEGWQLDQFLKHPVLVSSHDYRSLRNQIGEWEEMSVKGKRLVGVARYYTGQGNDEADWAFKLAERKRAAFSVGFVPIEVDRLEDGDGFEFRTQELIEVSEVVVPANGNALQRMATMAADPVLKELALEELEARGEKLGADIWTPDEETLRSLIREELAQFTRDLHAIAQQQQSEQATEPKWPLAAPPNLEEVLAS